MLLRFQVVGSRGYYTAVLVDWEWRRWELGARRQIIGNVLPFLFGVGSNSATAPHGRIIVKRAFALELFAERCSMAIEESNLRRAVGRKAKVQDAPWHVRYIGAAAMPQPRVIHKGIAILEQRAAVELAQFPARALGVVQRVHVDLILRTARKGLCACRDVLLLTLH